MVCILAFCWPVNGFYKAGGVFILLRLVFALLCPCYTSFAHVSGTPAHFSSESLLAAMDTFLALRVVCDPPSLGVNKQTPFFAFALGQFRHDGYLLSIILRDLLLVQYYYDFWALVFLYVHFGRSKVVVGVFGVRVKPDTQYPFSCPYYYDFWAVILLDAVFAISRVSIDRLQAVRKGMATNIIF